MNDQQRPPYEQSREEEHPWTVSSDDSSDGQDEEYSRPASAGRDDGYWQAPFKAPPRREPEYRPLPTDNGFSVRALTEGAMMVAVSIVLSVIASYVPVLSAVGALLFPLPMTILVFRRGLKVGIVATVVLLALSAMLLGIAQAAILLIEYGVLGLFLGYCFRTGKKPLSTVGWATLIAAIGTVAGILLSMYISGLSLYYVLDYVQEYVVAYMEAIQAAGLDSRLLAEGQNIEDYIAELTALMQRLLPGILIISSMMLTLLLYIITGSVMRKLRYNVARLPKFVDWRVDWRLSWGVVLGLLLNIVGSKAAIPWLATLGANLNYIFFPILSICGLSLLIWCFKNLYTSLALKFAAIIILLCFASFALYILMLLAVLDAVRDLRPSLTAWSDKRREENKYR